MAYMDLMSLVLLLLVVALGWFWFDCMSALEIARARAKQLCIEANVQFLDDTVASTGLSLSRNASGNRALCRRYRFEFSETGNSRLEGGLILLGDRVESFSMEPYQIVD